MPSATTVVSKPKEMQTSSSTHKDQKAASDLGELENSVDNCSCGSGGELHDNGNCDKKRSPQQNPIPMNTFSKELQQNNLVKARGHSSANSIILSVNALSKDMEEKGILPQDDDKANL